MYLRATLFFLAILTVVAVLDAYAQVPRTLSYQGVLTDSLGHPKQDGTYSFTFRLYMTGSGGTALWTETKNLAVSRGLFNTSLGDLTPIELPFTERYWLGVSIGAESELLPRVPLNAVGYSLYSVNADTAQYALSAPQLSFIDSARIAGNVADNAITSAKILNGTIQRVDVALGFVAPFADTAAYARVAPQSGVVDSARIAGTVANGAITSPKIADGAVSTGKLADASVTAGKIAVNQVVKSMNGVSDLVTLRAVGGATITSNGDTITINAGSGGGGTGIQGVQNTNNTLDIVNPNGPSATINVKNQGIGTAQLADASVTQAKIATGVTLPPGGTAGGDLTGTYPNPSVANNAIGTTKIADNAVTTSKLPDAAVTPSKLNSTGASSGQVLKFNGTNVSWGNDNIGGLSLPYSGSGSVSGTTPLFAVSNMGTGYGIDGRGGQGVHGESNAANGFGVVGYVSATTGFTRGVYGQSDSPDGHGVGGYSSGGTAIYGLSLSGFAVRGETNSGFVAIAGKAGLNGRGVYGEASSGSGGIPGTPNNTGVVGVSGSGIGVYGASVSGDAIRATKGITNVGRALYLENINSSNSAPLFELSTNGTGNAVSSTTSGTGNAGNFRITNTSSSVPAMFASTNGSGSAVRGLNNGTGQAALFEIANSGSSSDAVSATTNGSGIALKGTSNGGYAIYGTNIDPGDGYGVYGEGGDGGVDGWAYVGNGGIGVRGRAPNANGTGVFGSGGMYGIYGEAIGSGSIAIQAFGNNYGLSGEGPNIGVYAHNTSGTPGRDVYLATQSLAADMYGNLFVHGNVTKSGGSFKIDHPLDPVNKYLYHSFVESPDMKNIYDGVVTLDARGEATVALPAWFEALNKDFRYQLTAISAPGPNLHIARKISGNSFTISGGSSGMEVSWQITGTRQDAWANAHRIPVEEDKKPEERGFYEHPELFGQPESRSIQNSLHPETERMMTEQKIMREKIKTLETNAATSKGETR